MSAEGDGSKIYVSCIAFRDPVCEDIAEAYRIPPNSFADKCICLVSRSPSFRVLREALEELFVLCFSPVGSRFGLGYLLWYIRLAIYSLCYALQVINFKCKILFTHLWVADENALNNTQ